MTLPARTSHGQATIRALAEKHGLTEDDVVAMAHAVSLGGGTMAQFNVPSLGGQGQWMAGGMTMVGDMFNTGLQVRVAELCSELASAMASDPLFEPPKTIAQSWPDALGHPAASGGQNQMRYAYFPSTRRIAVDLGTGEPMRLFDCGEHLIGGFSQQQTGGSDPLSGLSFSSQYGQFSVSSLTPVQETQPNEPSASPVAATVPADASVQASPPVSGPALNPEPIPSLDPQSETPAPVSAPLPVSVPTPTPAPAPTPTQSADEIIAMLEKLGQLRDKGILTDQEFTEKKTDLLSRL